MWEYAQGTTSGTLNATIFAALIPTQGISRFGVLCLLTEELSTLLDVLPAAGEGAHGRCWRVGWQLPTIRTAEGGAMLFPLASLISA
jgi:hypothetical protein